MATSWQCSSCKTNYSPSVKECKCDVRTPISNRPKTNPKATATATAAEVVPVVIPDSIIQGYIGLIMSTFPNGVLGVNGGALVIYTPDTVNDCALEATDGMIGWANT